MSSTIAAHRRYNAAARRWVAKLAAEKGIALGDLVEAAGAVPYPPCGISAASAL